ncbi:MAG: hypothetical protein J0M05_01995 [Candidatus Kapabacteria bacterium]|nr:hypothetical protein [Candidatus Kapabacteria bacterium]
MVTSSFVHLLKFSAGFQLKNSEAQSPFGGTSGGAIPSNESLTRYVYSGIENFLLFRFGWVVKVL